MFRKSEVKRTIYSAIEDELEDPLQDQNNVIRVSSGPYRTTPIDSFYCELGELSLTLRRQIISSSYETKQEDYYSLQTLYATDTRYAKNHLPFYERNRQILASIQLQQILQSPYSTRIPPP